MKFEKFEGTNLRMGKPQISVTTRGQMGVNKGALVRYELDRYNYVVLYYAKDTKTVGMKFTTGKEEPSAIKLSKREDAGFIISALSFFRTYKIVHSKLMKYDFEYNQEYQLYTFQLDQKAVE